MGEDEVEKRELTLKEQVDELKRRLVNTDKAVEELQKTGVSLQRRTGALEREVHGPQEDDAEVPER